MKLLVAIPSRDDMPTESVISLLRLAERLTRDGVDHEIKITTGTLVHVGRDKLALHAINNGYTHVLWLDSDMVYTDDILDDLMFSGHDFVTGIAHSRRKPYSPCVFKSLKNVERFEEYPKDTFEIAGCGFACVFISVEILKEVQRHFGTCFLPTKELGEDLAFCYRARYLNHKIYAEPGAILGHIGRITVYPDDYQRYMKEVSSWAF